MSLAETEASITKRKAWVKYTSGKYAYKDLSGRTKHLNVRDCICFN